MNLIERRKLRESTDRGEAGVSVDPANRCKCACGDEHWVRRNGHTPEERREYRVVWQREGRVQQVKRYATKKAAEQRYALLTSNEPWAVLGYDSADWVCCNGRECACGGETFRVKTERIAAETPLRFARLESRAVSEWQEVK